MTEKLNQIEENYLRTNNINFINNFLYFRKYAKKQVQTTKANINKIYHFGKKVIHYYFSFDLIISKTSGGI